VALCLVLLLAVNTTVGRCEGLRGVVGGSLLLFVLAFDGSEAVVGCRVLCDAKGVLFNGSMRCLVGTKGLASRRGGSGSCYGY
jgi:hypothetical protein